MRERRVVMNASEARESSQGVWGMREWARLERRPPTPCESFSDKRFSDQRSVR